MRKITLSGTPQQKFDQIALELNNLSNSVNAKEQSSGRGFTGKEGDIQIIEDVEKNKLFGINTKDGWFTTFAECLQSYKPGTIPRLKLTSLEVDNLFAKVYTINQTQAINGNQIMGAGSGVVESIIDATKIRIKDQTGLGVCGFAVNDKCEIRQVNPSSLADIKLVQFTVTAVSGQEITVTYTGANRPVKGDTIFVKGNSGTASRQNSIYFSTVDTNSPYIDLYTGTTSFTFGTTIARIGNLTGITDADFGGALSGYGIYTTNAYFKGKISLANNGSISLGKTAYNDTTNAGFWFGDSDATIGINPYFYLGNAGDTKYIKVNTTAGTFTTLGFDITGGLFQTATGTINKILIDSATNYITITGNNVDNRIIIASSTNPFINFKTAIDGTTAQLNLATILTGASSSANGLSVSNHFGVNGTINPLGIYIDNDALKVDSTGIIRLSGKVVDSPTTGYFKYNGTKFIWDSTGGMVYPGSGIAVSNGSAWGTSISGTSSQFVKGDGSLDSTTYLSSLSGAVLTTTNQNVGGTKTFTSGEVKVGELSVANGTYTILRDNGYYGSIYSDTISANRSWMLPNYSGTIALSSTGSSAGQALIWLGIQSDTPTVGGNDFVGYQSISTGDYRIHFSSSGWRTLTTTA